jgi:hypothetical protein
MPRCSENRIFASAENADCIGAVDALLTKTCNAVSFRIVAVESVSVGIEDRMRRNPWNIKTSVARAANSVYRSLLSDYVDSASHIEPTCPEVP